MKRKVVVLLCAWSVWHMLIVDHAQKWIKVSDHTSLSECVDSVKVYAPYEKKHGPLVYYADLKQPSHWYGCFPEGFDPRN